MFGKSFENHDCPELTKFFLNAITLGQTFNDHFTFIRGDGICIPLGMWQTNLERWFQVVLLCEMVKLRLIIISFIHKEIQNQWEIKNCIMNIHEFIGNHIFFDDRLLERWLKLCSYEIVSSDIGFDLSSDNAMQAEEVLNTLDNVFIIFDKEVTNGNEKHFNIYVYDGNFLRESSEKELIMLSDEILPNVYCIRSSIDASPHSISQNCHERSICVKRVNPHRNMIDRLYDANEKFEYFNTVSGFVINRELDRLVRDTQKTLIDDAWPAFMFFLSLFSQVFTPSKALFSTEFVDLIEMHHSNKSIKKNLMCAPMVSCNLQFPTM